MAYYVYILASRRNGTLYIGSTSDLIARIWQHKNKLREGFTARYNVTQLVHFEEFEEVGMMAQREKRLKEWKRSWKIQLIEKRNPQWEDLYEKIVT
ncbi:MAG: GIY-YIG nuclease family protein [Flavobacteriales bacterium]|nr:GIY-YIG nuclease family protein [Flavobacteriales bacterium]